MVECKETAHSMFVNVHVLKLGYANVLHSDVDSYRRQPWTSVLVF